MKVKHVYLLSYDLIDRDSKRVLHSSKSYYGGNTEEEAISNLKNQWNCIVKITKVVRFDRAEERELII